MISTNFCTCILFQALQKANKNFVQAQPHRRRHDDGETDQVLKLCSYRIQFAVFNSFKRERHIGTCINVWIGKVHVPLRRRSQKWRYQNLHYAQPGSHCPAEFVERFQSFCFIRSASFTISSVMPVSSVIFAGIGRSGLTKVSKVSVTSPFTTRTAPISVMRSSLGRKSGRFQIEGDEFSRKGLVAFPGYRRNQIIDKISFHPINHFNRISLFFISAAAFIASGNACTTP